MVSCVKGMGHHDEGAFKKILAGQFLRMYISAVMVDLRTGAGFVVKSDTDQEIVGKEVPWPFLLERYAQRRACPEDRELIYSFTLDRLKAFLLGEEAELFMNVRCINTQRELYDWIKVEASVISQDDQRVLVTTRLINQEHIMNKIVETYVFQNLDYLIVIDAKHNQYSRLSDIKPGVPTPFIHGEDYTADVIRFNRHFLMPEDMERVTANMQLDNVIRMLEILDPYSFTSGGVDETGAYRRTRVQFTYYDKSNSLILVSRTNITQMFLEEQDKNNRLSAAMRAAQHDALTGVYNQKAVSDIIGQVLENQYRNPAALLFIDVDISVYPRDGTEYEMLVRKADQALYTSKRYGKNKVSF